MRRVVVTGLGVVSSIGCSIDEASNALRHSRSGLISMPQLCEAELPCSVYGPVKGLDKNSVDRRARLTMSDVAIYAAAAARDALRDSNLQIESLDVARTGVVLGTAFGGINEVNKMHRFLMAGKKSRAGATGVTKFMNSTAAGNVAAMLGLKGRAYSVSSNAASGTDNIGHGFELVKHDLADTVVCGAAEEDCWRQIGPCLASWKLLPTEYNDQPTRASRPYDADRRGLVLSAGAGVLVLESLSQAQKRGAQIYGEIVGYAAANDGKHLLQPTGQGLRNAMSRALSDARSQSVDRIDYVNSHATGTRVGDCVEAAVLRELFGEGPYVSSTKGLTGHAIGASGAMEAAFTLLMMAGNFVAPTMNLQHIDPDCKGISHVQKVQERELNAAISFSVGLGGFNSVIVFRRVV